MNLWLFVAITIPLILLIAAGFYYRWDDNILAWVRQRRAATTTTPSRLKTSGTWLKSLSRNMLKGIKSAFLPVWHTIRGIRNPDASFNPISWNLLFRPIASAIAGGLAALVLKGVFTMLFYFGLMPVDPINGTIMLALTALVTLAVIRPDTDENGNPFLEKVPETDFGALVTFLGMPLPIIRITGEYTWVGKRIGLDRSRKILVGIELKGDDQNYIKAGFIPLGDITFPIWDSAHPDPNKREEKFQISIPAKNRATIRGSLTLIFRLIKPRLWLKAGDPALDLGDRARQEYQEMIDRVNDTDVAAIQAEMQNFFLGKPFLTAFIPSNVGYHKVGAIIRDRSGKVMLQLVEKGEVNGQEQLENGKPTQAAINNFKARLIAEADADMLKTIKTTPATGEDIAVTILQVSDPLTEVTTARGAELVRITFGDIVLSDKVRQAAEQASAESDERQAQIYSAETIKKVRETLKPTEDELADRETFELNTILAAAQDSKNGNIKVTMVPGASALGRSIVAAGQAAGDSK